MRPSDKLFQLIKSLTKSEKRYFKLFASMYGGRKNYILLFDAIDAQDVYDEDRLRAQLEDEHFVRQLSAAKHYLREQILRSLRAFHSETSAHTRIREMLHNIEILYGRQLIDQARREFDAALALASEHEDFIALMSIHGWSERLGLKQCIDHDGITGIFAPIRDALERYRNYIDYSEAGRRMMLPMNGDQVRTRQDLEAMEIAVSGFPEEELSVRAAAVHAACRASYHYARREFAEGLVFADRRVRLLEQHPALMLADPLSYVGAVCNQMVHYLALDRFELFWETVEKLNIRTKELLERNMALGDRVRAQIFVAVYGNQMALMVGLRESERYAALASEVEAGLLAHRSHISYDELLKFHHYLSLFYLALGDHRRALENNLRIVQESQPEHGWFTWYHARLVHLVIHYEMGNTDLLEYLVKSTYRHFRSHGVMHRFEGAVLEFFRRALRVKDDRADVLALFRESRARFAELASDPLEAHFFLYFDYIGWFDAKIESLQQRRPAVPGQRHRWEDAVMNQVGAAQR